MKKVIIAAGIGICALLSPVERAFSQTDHVPAAAETTGTQQPVQAPVAASSPEDTSPAPQTSRELWSGSLYTSTYRAGVCLDPDGAVRGVLLVRTMNGAVDPYHFYGTFKDGIVRASHGSGHSFEGSFSSDKEVTGTITLKGGRKVTLTGKRQKNVTLTETCRPLPE